MKTCVAKGFELSISRPQVLFQDIDGKRHEPIEEATIDVDDEYSGVVIEKLTGHRKGELVEMKQAGAGKTRIVAHVPARGLIGYHGEFLTDTRGTGVLEPCVPRLGAIPKVKSLVVAQVFLFPWKTVNLFRMRFST